jgi:hypothetical protein
MMRGRLLGFQTRLHHLWIQQYGFFLGNVVNGLAYFSLALLNRSSAIEAKLRLRRIFVSANSAFGHGGYLGRNGTRCLFAPTSVTNLLEWGEKVKPSEREGVS